MGSLIGPNEGINGGALGARRPDTDISAGLLVFDN